MLKVVKNAYIVSDLCLIAVGVLLLFCPSMALNIMCKIFGAVLVLLGIVKVLGYYTKDIFQLAFQFDFAMGIISMILGIMLITRTTYRVDTLSVGVGIFILVDGTLKIQTASDARRFGIERWWYILIIALAVSTVGLLLLVVPFQTASAVTRIMGLNLVLDGILNILVVQSTVSCYHKKKGGKDYEQKEV
ncbi:MAG: HdeD family acid-resistance protein [Lachnospiraceae bacterium]